MIRFVTGKFLSNDSSLMPTSRLSVASEVKEKHGHVGYIFVWFKHKELSVKNEIKFCQ